MRDFQTQSVMGMNDLQLEQLEWSCKVAETKGEETAVKKRVLEIIEMYHDQRRTVSEREPES